MPDIIVLNAAETAYEGIKGSSIMEANDIKKCYAIIQKFEDFSSSFKFLSA